MIEPNVVIMTNFNSNMVRLRGAVKNQFIITDNKFQFQYGAIKSILMSVELMILLIFQFQYGAIKRATVD